MDLREYIKIYDDAVPHYAIASFVKIANTLDFEEGKTGKNVLNKKKRSVQIAPLSPFKFI